MLGDIKSGRESIEDVLRSGGLADATDTQTVAEVKGLNMEDHQVRVDKISIEFLISHGSIFTIIHKLLGFVQGRSKMDPPKPQCSQRRAASGIMS